MKAEFDNSYRRLPGSFFEPGTPEKVADPGLILFNTELANELGLSFESDSPETLAAIFSGHEILEGSQPLSQAYAGHQFGNFVPQLGDGRAHLLGEVIGVDGSRYDIQLKGSGVSRFSRGGDGRSPLGPVLREYIVSEAMHAMAIPTTRALAAVTTGETVLREESLAGGIFTRVALSHLRVGTFEYFLRKGDHESLKTLFEYAVGRHYPKMDPKDPEAPLQFFDLVRNKIARLVAKWMGVGFIHGVMNTDNTSVAGITIDYGPCAFMDDFQFDRVFSYIDRRGRYAFANQPRIAMWNLERLAECMIPLMPMQPEKAVKKITARLNDFESIFQESWLDVHRLKFGFTEPFQGEIDLYQDFFAYMQENKVDFTLAFLGLEASLSSASLPEHLQNNASLQRFLKAWNKALAEAGQEISQAIEVMQTSNPQYIPRNHLVEKAIQDGYRGNFQTFKDLLEVTTDPFSRQDKGLQFRSPPKEEEKVANTFCGT